MLQLSIEGHEARSSILPHLEFNANSSQLDVRLDGLDTQFDSSRFAMELVLVTSTPEDSSQMQIRTHKSIDDEHSPGTFKVSIPAYTY